MRNKTLSIFLLLLLVLPMRVAAQVGEHRDDLSIGVNGGYVLSNVGFSPKVSQSLHGGITGGLSVRYVCEKYFNTICSIYGEVNYASIGWQEKIQTSTDQPVINANGQAEKYSRTINYIQIPIFAHLAWGRETRGAQFFFQIGPQMGIYLNEQTDINYALTQRNLTDRANKIKQQEEMPLERKFDYGIAAGIGAEYSIPRMGHFLVEARYYYGLGNIYGDSKRDYFGKSNFGNIVMKAAYLFDLTKKRN